MKRYILLLLILGGLLCTGCLKLETSQKTVAVKNIAPDFALPDQNGKMISLSDLVANGPAVVVFYRGHWCVFCRRQLRELTELKPRFDEHRIPIVAISVDGHQESLELIEDKGFTVPLLSDPERKIITVYGVAMAGDDIAVPATFVVDQNREIVFRHVGETMADRPTHEELLELVIELKANQS